MSWYYYLACHFTSLRKAWLLDNVLIISMLLFHFNFYLSLQKKAGTGVQKRRVQTNQLIIQNLILIYTAPPTTISNPSSNVGVSGGYKTPQGFLLTL